MIRLMVLAWLLMAAPAWGVVPAFEDSMAQRLLACTACHGEQGRAGPDGYYPRLAGKPAGYLYQQLQNFRTGRRHYAPMERLLQNLSDDYLLAMAEHFAAQEVPYAAPTAAPPQGVRAVRGKQLVSEGDKSRNLPACGRCHGQTLMGAEPAVPALLGLPRDYLNAQLGAWRTQRRQSTAPDCMAEVARSLSDDDLAAVVDWLAAQPVPSGSKAAKRLPQPMPTRCGITEAAQHNGGSVPAASPPTAQAPASRGLVLARQGNCIHCHTAPGGSALAGGRRIDTPFGAVFSSNITPDPQTGLGQWSRDDFWRALHHGQSRDGRWLSPAFPYTNFTWVSRADADAIFDWVQTQAPVRQTATAPTLAWPFGSQWALGLWRTAFFSPGDFRADPARSEQWNRGAYLARGLGHCDACHGARNPLGAQRQAHALGGAMMPGAQWYAPSLSDPREAGVQDWALTDIVRLLKTGQGRHAQVAGPMAEVVQHSLQHWPEADLLALAVYLKDQPHTASRAPERTATAVPGDTLGARVYQKHCVQCHGAQGEGVASAYPALANSRSVNSASSVNLVQAVLHGGFAPSTPAHPRPFGMPPFALRLNDQEIAAVLSHVRSSWGNAAAAVSPVEVDRLRQRKN